MKQLMVSTRGTFDLHNGYRLKHKKLHITPKSKFDKLRDAKEVVIFIHGMRNSTKGAKMGTNALRLKLRKLGYKHPIIGFSYDSNIRGAHLEKNYDKVLDSAYNIAWEVGDELADLVIQIYKINYSIKIRFVGHSLGCEVIRSAVDKLGFIEVDVHLFGSPLESNEVVKMLSKNVSKITNYYNPHDSVIRESVERGNLKYPSCLEKIHNSQNNSPHLVSKRIMARDHRFKSQMKALRHFP